MIRRHLLLAPLFLALGLPLLRAADEPEKDTPQKIVEDFKTEFGAIEKNISIVTDEKTAKEAAPDIEKCTDNLVAVFKRMEKFPKPPADLAKSFSEFVYKTGNNIDTSLKNLRKSSPEAAKIVEKSLSKLNMIRPPEAWGIPGGQTSTEPAPN